MAYHPRHCEYFNNIIFRYCLLSAVKYCNQTPTHTNIFIQYLTTQYIFGFEFSFTHIYTQKHTHTYTHTQTQNHTHTPPPNIFFGFEFSFTHTHTRKRTQKHAHKQNHTCQCSNDLQREKFVTAAEHQPHTYTHVPEYS